MDRDTAATLRAQALRGLVLAARDDGEVQTVTVETHDGVTRADVEVMQPFGHGSCPPEGGLTVLLAAGGDAGDPLALPVAAPGTRFGGLAPGESVLYDAAGQYVLLRDGVIVEIAARQQVLVRAPKLRLEGDLEVTGRIAAQGDVTAGTVSLQQHVHGGVAAGAAKTGTPAP